MDVKGLTESSKGKAGGTFISVDNVSALVTVGDLVRYTKRVHQMSLAGISTTEHTEVVCNRRRRGPDSSL